MNTYEEYDAAGRRVLQIVLASPVDEANRVLLLQRATSALSSNAAFLALAAPTAGQAIAQTQALTRQVDALIRLAALQLDAADGT